MQTNTASETARRKQQRSRKQQATKETGNRKTENRKLQQQQQQEVVQKAPFPTCEARVLSSVRARNGHTVPHRPAQSSGEKLEKRKNEEKSKIIAGKATKDTIQIEPIQ
jgi:hypothetical protein